MTRFPLNPSRMSESGELVQVLAEMNAEVELLKKGWVLLATSFLCFNNSLDFSTGDQTREFAKKNWHAGEELGKQILQIIEQLKH